MKKFNLLTLPLVAVLSLLVGCATSPTAKKPTPLVTVYSPVPPPSPSLPPMPPPLPEKSVPPAKAHVAKPSLAYRNPSGFFVISNPTPVVTLAWDPSTDPIVNKYTIYYGVATKSYTNNSTVVSNGPPCTITNATVALPANGVTYFFAATASDTYGLESDFSNEVSWATPAIPTPPNLHPVIVLIVETENNLGDPWLDSGLPQFAVYPNAPNQFFRLRIVAVQ
jgi:hypothetical protein